MFETKTKFIALYYLIINIIAFLLFFIDKRRAKKNKWRIPENQLFLAAFLGGGIGAMIGMNLFKHKTSKNLFKILIPVSIGVHVYVIYMMIYK